MADMRLMNDLRNFGEPKIVPLRCGCCGRAFLFGYSGPWIFRRCHRALLPTPRLLCAAQTMISRSAQVTTTRRSLVTLTVYATCQQDGKPRATHLFTAIYPQAPSSQGADRVGGYLRDRRRRGRHSRNPRSRTDVGCHHHAVPRPRGFLWLRLLTGWSAGATGRRDSTKPRVVQVMRAMERSTAPELH